MLITGDTHDGYLLPQMPGVSFAPSYDPPGYLIGSNGMVWSKYSKSGTRPLGWNRIKTLPRRDGLKYNRAHLRLDDGKGKVATRYVHRLVLEAFVGPCPPNCQALHVDGNVANNWLHNLRWGTPKENTADKYRHGTVLFGCKHFASKCTPLDVLVAHYLHRTGKVSQQEIAELVNQPLSMVQASIAGSGYPRETRAARLLLDRPDATLILLEEEAFTEQLQGA